MLTRRDFNRLAMAGAATSAFSPLWAQSSDRKFGYCIIGLGRISMGHFMPGVAASKTCTITGLVSGHREKALEQAKKYGVPESSIYTYENMEEIKNNPAIDAVYVALPNSMHAEYTIRSAKAGKHVLCEKPMATTVADSKAMIQACKDANKKLMIAYRCHYEPTNKRAIQLIREGKLGKIQSIESANGFRIAPGEWRRDRKMAGGGPLMDVGVYSLNACRYLTGEEPVEIKALAATVEKDAFPTVEENLAWVMTFPSGAVASCSTTYGANQNGFYRVHGSQGVLAAEPGFIYEGLHLTAAYKDPAGGKKPIMLDEPNPDKDPSQFTTQADYFVSCVREDKQPQTAGEEGLTDMQLMSKIYESAGLPTL